MKKFISLISLMFVFVFFSGFTSSNTVMDINSKSKTIKGKIGVGKALGYACQLKIVSSGVSGLYSPIFTVEFSYVNKFISKSDKNLTKLYNVKEYFNLEQYGENETFFGRKLNQNVAANQQPTTLQVFKDVKTNLFKAIYYNGNHLVCDNMVIF